MWGVGLSEAHISQPPPPTAPTTATWTPSLHGLPVLALEAALGQDPEIPPSHNPCRGGAKGQRRHLGHHRRNGLPVALLAGGDGHSRPAERPVIPPCSTRAPPGAFFFFFLSPRLRSEPRAGSALPRTLLPRDPPAREAWGLLQRLPTRRLEGGILPTGLREPCCGPEATRSQGVRDPVVCTDRSACAELPGGASGGRC